jgi:hypothetical protein
MTKFRSERFENLNRSQNNDCFYFSGGLEERSCNSGGDPSKVDSQVLNVSQNLKPMFIGVFIDFEAEMPFHAAFHGETMIRPDSVGNSHGRQL